MLGYALVISGQSLAWLGLQLVQEGCARVQRLLRGNFCHQGYEALVPRVVRLLARLNPEKERDAQGRSLALDRASIPPEYAYYGIPSPWLQVHTLQDCRWLAATQRRRSRLRSGILTHHPGS